MGCLLCLLLPLPETFHFHLRAGSVPCNLHLCSDSCSQGLASREAGVRRASGAIDQGGLGHPGAREGDSL